MDYHKEALRSALDQFDFEKSLFILEQINQEIGME